MALLGSAYILTSKDTPSLHDPGTLLVSAEGKVQVSPDTVVIRAGIEIRGEATQEAAYQKMNTSVASVHDILGKAGIDAKHIQTSGLSASEDFYWGEEGRKSQGYRAHQSLTVRIEKHEISVVNTVLDALSRVAHINIHGVEYDLSDKEGVYREARKLAVEKARAKAEEMAAAAGVKLGSIEQIQEGNGQNIFFPRAQNAKMLDLANAEAAAMDSTDISVGQLDYTTTVTISYRVQ